MGQNKGSLGGKKRRDERHLRRNGRTSERQTGTPCPPRVHIVHLKSARVLTRIPVGAEGDSAV